jgi:hypothetical protein
MWEDWELSIRLEANAPCQMLDELLVLTFETPGSVNHNTALRSSALDVVMQKHPQWLSTSGRVRARHDRLCMMYEIDAGRPDRARHFMRQALRHDPTYWKTWASIARRLPQLRSSQAS